MTERQFHDAIDRFLVEAWTLVWSIATGIGAAFAWAWAALPGDWHPALKALVLVVVLAVALRLLRSSAEIIRFVVGWPFRLVGLWLMKLRSPFGQSDWASRADMRRAGMTRRGGLFLGQWRSWFRRADLYRPGEGHLLTIGGSGSGKTTSVVIPALLEAQEGSFIVIDPKAQLAAMTGLYLNKWIAEQTANSQAAVAGVLGQFFGNYGADGQKFLQTHGNTLTDFSKRMGGQAMGPLQQKAQAAFTEWKGKKQAESIAIRSQQKYRDAPGFCGCNISAAMSNNIDLALYTSSLRMFKPKGVIDLENGRVFEAECGKAPVV